MNCKEQWQPSKFVYRNGKLKASRNSKDVGISSRLVVNIIARFYDANLKKYAKGQLLDLGCGKVPLYEAYKDYIENNTCVDWENPLHFNNYLDYNIDLNNELPLTSETYDTIILSDVLEHIKNPFLLWGELFRLLKPNGILIMNVPFFYWLHAEPYDYFRYTKHAIKSMAEENGFKIINLNATGGAPEILADISAKLVLKIPLIGTILSRFIQKLTWLFINTRIGKKMSEVSSGKFPLGYTLIAEK